MDAYPIEILLIEDSPADRDLTIMSLKRQKFSNNITFVEDGAEAIDYLFKRGRHVNAQTPDLIILDLNLPKIDGREVLQRIKGDANLKKIPIVVLTTSDADIDIMRSYQLNANCYITKPVSLEKFREVVSSIGEFWFSIVKLPK
jgi:two-component system, chemotaxis family, response regulator Rcp1